MSKPSAVAPLTAAARQERSKKMSMEGEKAWAEHEASAEATEAKTKRLRALRLEREVADAASALAAAPTKPKKAPTKAALEKKAAPKTIRRNIPLG